MSQGIYKPFGIGGFWVFSFLGVFVFSCFRVFSRRKFLGGGGLTKDTGRKKSKQLQATSFQIGSTVSRHKDTVAEGACARTLLHDSDGAN